MNVYELKPTRGQKSFYGKARVTELENGTKILTSYTTDVAKIDAGGKAHRLWGSWSATTANHFNSFFESNGLPRLSKAEWFEMPVE